MAVKLNGKQLREFWNSDWGLGEPGTYYADDMYGTVNGVEKEDLEPFWEDTDKIVVKGGVIYWESTNPDILETQETDLVTFIRKWLKAQKTAYLTIEVPLEDVEEFKLHLKAFSRAKVVGR